VDQTQARRRRVTDCILVFAIYSTLAILVAYTIAAVWGVGIETIALAGELPHGLSRGTAFQEALIKFVAYSSAPTGLVLY
jgi:(hydroxyamino)benzene mutase